ncbi:MAG TPA: class I SAM-dependent methyltransferase [Candidatus Aquilonibacter sp.]|jgi:ubiquinone/menaquinone biosynthesis C-methylase UbiE|nr:class I SAM-dependent methyltransferase [Candidatus Aquilonibacter sp.]
MSAIQQQAYPAPFDAVAARYDETFTRSLIGQAQRSAVWRELEKTFRPGDRVLEIGCGTGVDACFLAHRGVRVIGCDSSPQMIRVAAQKVRNSGLDELVQPRLLRAEDIATLPANEPFDGVLSNFGALNCVEDLGKTARDLARLLKPGASALLCWMGPRCAWEMIWYLSEGNRTKALRRLRPDGAIARIADGAVLHVHYPTVCSLARAFAPYFRVKSVRGIGVAVPPSYLEPWAQRHPILLQLFERADLALGRCPGIRMLADHLLVRLQRVETARFMVEL